jgi:hypothetical protein
MACKTAWFAKFCGNARGFRSAACGLSLKNYFTAVIMKLSGYGRVSVAGIAKNFDGWQQSKRLECKKK